MIHLHDKSCYSLLESPQRPEQIAQAALEAGQSAAVLCDHNTMYGTMEFIHACKERQLQPIIGLEVDAQHGLNPHPLLLLAGNTKGLQDLFALSSRLSTLEQKSLPLEDIAPYTHDAVVLACSNDEIIENLCKSGLSERLAEWLEEMSGLFERLYAAISLNDSPTIRASNKVLKSACKAIGIPTVAVSRIDYQKPEDHEAALLLEAIGRQTQLSDRSLKSRSGRYWRSIEEMEQLYEPGDLQTSDEIASMIVPYDLPKASLPRFPNKAGSESSHYLRSLCIAGLKKRLQGRIPEVYASRLEHELSVILSMGFADYFLIVWDFIREARSRGILVGPGRGSAAGSLVAWVLGISHIDPVANGLLFERFLNPERISMPDIDTDFPDDRRDEIIAYMQEKYGTGHAAHIVTFARFKARLALRDTAKALGILQADIDRLARLIPSGPNVTLQDAMDHSEVFKGRVESSPSLSKLYQLARSIEGLPRHASIHAGGIVVAKDPIVQQAPLADLQAQLPAVQFSMEYLEELGLIKFDFLALRNLSLLQSMNDQLKASTGSRLNLLSLPLNDPGVYRLLCQGLTMGVFQLESEGIRQLILRFQPNRFEDIAAILALYRPGPMKNIDLYLQARKGKKPASLHPLLDGLLAETGGIFLYQEQIMEAARIIGGFSLSQADILRKAMSKKKRDVMESWKEKFIQGAAERKIGRQDAERIFDVMEEFADYGFNKSHSYAYGLLVYQMAYIKAHAPVVFYQCCLNGCLSSSAKTSQFIREAKMLQITVLPVSLNESSFVYEAMPQGLRMPFSLLSSISMQSAQKIVRERTEHGPFADPITACARLLEAGLSRKEISVLVRAGCFDELSTNRETILENFDTIMSVSGLLSRDAKSGSLLFENISPPSLENAAPNILQRLSDERETYGFFVSNHPARELRRRHRELKSTAELNGFMGYASVAGIVISVKEHRTKKGEPMAFATIQDDQGEFELVIMPEYYQSIRTDLPEGKFVVARGRKNRERSMIVNQFLPADLPDALPAKQRNGKPGKAEPKR